MTTSSVELSIDVETYSEADIKLGAYRYAADPTFEMLLIAYHFSDEDCVRQIDVAMGYEADDHQRFLDALQNPKVKKTAFNANFERTTLARWLGVESLDPDEWRCTMILAAQMGLPMSLAGVGEALGLPEDSAKLKTGKALIQYFCKPCNATKANGGRLRNLPMHDEAKWQLFKEYNLQDVVAEEAIRERLRGFEPGKTEQSLWSLDQRINDRGVLLDIDMAHKVVDYSEARKQALAEMAKDITGLENPNSPTQLRGWLTEQGVITDSLAKGAVEDLLSGDLPEDVRTVLGIRADLSKTSINKYQTMLDIACPDGRARGIMQFYGGHTGRWAGRVLQPQNLTKNHMDDDLLDLEHGLIKTGEFEALEAIEDDMSDILSQMVRTAFIPSEGCHFIVTDFSAIEARVIAWVAGEQWRLDVFENGGDIYCESASRIYHKPVVKHGINGELRQRGKVAELALGYQGGVGAMKSMDTRHEIPEDEMQGIVDQWRKESPNVVNLWRTVQKCAIAAVKGSTSVEDRTYRIPGTSEKIRFKLEFLPKSTQRVLSIYLPSKRAIRLFEPRVSEGEYGEKLSYMNIGQVSRKWQEVDTYGGKLTENIVQGIARDCLAVKMTELDELGYKTVFHVHDEMVLDVIRKDEGAFKLIDRIMAEPISWARGLPLKGGTYECDFYRKD